MRISDWSSDVCSSDLLNFDLHFRFHKPDDDGGRRRANVAKGSAKRRANLVPLGGVGEIIGRADHIGEREARLPARLLDQATRVFRLFCRAFRPPLDRTSVVAGTMVSVRVSLGW